MLRCLVGDTLGTVVPTVHSSVDDCVGRVYEMTRKSAQFELVYKQESL